MTEEQSTIFHTALYWLADKIHLENPQLDAEECLTNANLLIQRFVLWRDVIPQEQNVLFGVYQREMIIGTIGTVVWGFGDWIVNLTIHCGMLSCGH